MGVSGKLDIFRIVIFRILVCLVYLSCTVRLVRAECPFDPCSFSGVCEEGLVCVVEEYCSHRCICDVNSTADECISASSAANHNVSVTMPDVHPYSVSSEPSCPCVHGKCRDGEHGRECICYKGWSGDFCNLTCTLDCDPGKICFRINELFMTCKPGESITERSTPTTPSSVETTAGSTVPGRYYNVCSDTYMQRPLAERRCSQSFECVHGVCETDGTYFRCTCDPGAIGQLCNKNCCRPCGEHGDCDILYETTETVCNCHQNYTGEFCSIYNPPKGNTSFFIVLVRSSLGRFRHAGQ